MPIERRRNAMLSCALLATYLTAACGSEGRKRESDRDPEYALGAINVSLATDDGSELQEVEYTIHDASGIELLRSSMKVSALGESLYIHLALPAASGYRIAVSANNAAQIVCAGERGFDVLAGETRDVAVDLLCDAGGVEIEQGDVVVEGTVRAAGSGCPGVAFVAVAPLRVSVGRPLSLIGAATSAVDALSVGWSATEGSIADQDIAQTTFTCAREGTVTVTFTVSDGASCNESESAEVTCVAPQP